MLGTPLDAPGPGPSNWAAHPVALTELLRARGQQQFATRNGCQLFQLCYHHIVSKAYHLRLGESREDRLNLTLLANVRLAVRYRACCGSKTVVRNNTDECRHPNPVIPVSAVPFGWR
jgi:hypothetical protein